MKKIGDSSSITLTSEYTVFIATGEMPLLNAINCNNGDYIFQVAKREPGSGSYIASFDVNIMTLRLDLYWLNLEDRSTF